MVVKGEEEEDEREEGEDEEEEDDWEESIMSLISCLIASVSAVRLLEL